MPTVTVNWEYEGIHWWDAAKGEVAFLSLPHRHLFKAHAQLSVKHDDREVEFIELKRLLQLSRPPTCGTKLVKDYVYNNLGSCEMQARFFARRLNALYPGRRISVGVSEDGENGAFVTFVKGKELR